jgi:hypothetical protein
MQATTVARVTVAVVLAFALPVAINALLRDTIGRRLLPRK